MISLLQRRSPAQPHQMALTALARVGYGARGFVYLSAGALTLLAAMDRIGGQARLDLLAEQVAHVVFRPHALDHHHQLRLVGRGADQHP